MPYMATTHHLPLSPFFFDLGNPFQGSRAHIHEHTHSLIWGLSTYLPTRPIGWSAGQVCMYVCASLGLGARETPAAVYTSNGCHVGWPDRRRNSIVCIATAAVTEARLRWRGRNSLQLCRTCARRDPGCLYLGEAGRKKKKYPLQDALPGRPCGETKRNESSRVGEGGG
jgi:hypothetical protein